MNAARGRVRLLHRLLAVPVLLILVVLAIVWIAIDYLAADYFMTLMKQYDVDASETNAMFLEATHRALLWAGAAGLGLGIALSYWLTRRLLTPLSRMIGVTRQVSQGDYSARAAVHTRDEVGELAGSFNRMAESLQRIEHLRRTMLIDVAHELRTPLTNVRGYLEALKDGVVPPSPEMFASLHDETLRLSKLVDDLMQLARAEAAGLTLRRQPVRMEDLLDRCLQMFRARFDDKGIDVQVAFPPAPRPIEADADKLAQAVHNLLDNAHAYTPRGGRVALSLDWQDEHIRFACTNTGDDIPTAELPFIFERLYRVDRARSRARGGSGLGLAIVKELVAAHGGEVGADSGAGQTCVWFRLPAITKPLPDPYGPVTPAP